MNQKDAAVVKVLTELGLRPANELTPTQEELLRAALDADEEFAYRVKRLFSGDSLSTQD